MAYCGQCGNRVYEGDQFCGSCGAVLLPEHRESAATQEVPSQPRTPPQYTSPRRNSTKLLALAIAMGLLVILLGGTGVMTLSGVNPIASVFGGAPPPEEASEDNSEAATPSPTTEEQESDTTPPSTEEETVQSSEPLETVDTSELEADAEEAVEEHYQMVGLEDWDYSYDNLDSSTQAMFTEEEWAKKNQYYWDQDEKIYHIESVNLIEQSLEDNPVVDVEVRLTGENGSSFVRETAFTLEGGSWKHLFLEEEIQSFRPDLSYEEFLEIQ